MVRAACIDVRQVSFVVFFDFPRRFQHLLLAAGRRGRFGRKGLAILLATNAEAPLVRLAGELHPLNDLPSDVVDLM